MKIRWLSILVVVGALASTSDASDKDVSRFTPEAGLQKAGIALDAESLILVTGSNRSPVLRRMAVQVLAKKGGHVEHLKHVAEDDDYYMVRVEAALLVGTNDVEFAVQQLKKELNGDISQLTSLRIAESLADLQDSSGLSVVLRSIKGKNALCRIKAAGILVKFTRFDKMRGTVSEALLEALGALQLRIGSEDPRVMRNAQREFDVLTEGLSVVGDSSALPRLGEIERLFVDQEHRKAIRAIMRRIEAGR